MTPALTEASDVLAIAETYPHMVTVRISKDVLRALVTAAQENEEAEAHRTMTAAQRRKMMKSLRPNPNFRIFG